MYEEIRKKKWHRFLKIIIPLVGLSGVNTKISSLAFIPTKSIDLIACDCTYFLNGYSDQNKHLDILHV
jgi:hypothetical protein